MRLRICFFISILITFSFSCSSSNRDSNIFQSEKLKGKYKVDLSPLINEVNKSNDVDFSKIGKGLASMALSSVDIEMSFFEKNKGIMFFDGGLIDLANAFSDKPIEKMMEFTYKVEQDSILYMKNIDDQKYRKWAIVRKFSENYDYLKFLIVEDGEEKVFFNLKKIAE